MIFYGDCAILNLFFVILCVQSPFRRPIFDNQFGTHRILVPFQNETVITRVEIFEDDMKGDKNSFSLIYVNNKIKKTRNVLVIDINFIDKDCGKQYILYVLTNRNEEFYYELFIYDKKTDSFTLTRMYGQKKFYIEYAPHICFGLVAGGALGALLYFFL
jgi:hypothetical protein